MADNSKSKQRAVRFTDPAWQDLKLVGDALLRDRTNLIHVALKEYLPKVAQELGVELEFFTSK